MSFITNITFRSNGLSWSDTFTEDLRYRTLVVSTKVTESVSRQIRLSSSLRTGELSYSPSFLHPPSRPLLFIPLTTHHGRPPSVQTLSVLRKPIRCFIDFSRNSSRNSGLEGHYPTVRYPNLGSWRSKYFWYRKYTDLKERKIMSWYVIECP